MLQLAIRLVGSRFLFTLLGFAPYKIITLTPSSPPSPSQATSCKGTEDMKSENGTLSPYFIMRSTRYFTAAPCSLAGWQLVHVASVFIIGIFNC